MALMTNPYELMRAGPRYMPDPYSGAGEVVSGRVSIVQGAPGVGKTHRLIDDLSSLDRYHKRIGYCDVTSKNNATVDEVNMRAFGISEKGHRTIHKTIWAWLGKELGGEVAVKWNRPREYFKKPFNKELVEQYVNDAEYDRRSKVNLSQEFTDWDPTKEPIPEHLADPRSLPPSCAYAFTMYRVCEEMDRRFRSGEIQIPPAGTPFRGALLVDEAQDLDPLTGVALGWYALDQHLEMRCYGDPNQMLDQERRMPFLWDQGAEVEPFFGSDPHRRRVPMSVGKLCEQVLPGLVPPAEDWCNPSKEGLVLPVTTKDKRHLIETSAGFTICESRYRVATACGFVAPGVTVGPAVECRVDAVISTPFMLKGRESDLVTIQRWMPKHQDAYRDGSLVARRRLNVSLSRTTDRLVMHNEMLDMILEGSSFRWT